MVLKYVKTMVFFGNWTFGQIGRCRETSPTIRTRIVRKKYRDTFQWIVPSLLKIWAYCGISVFTLNIGTPYYTLYFFYPDVSKHCQLNGRQCRSWSVATECGVWSGSALFAQACLSQYLGLRLPRLGKGGGELVLVLFVCLIDLCLFGFVGFLFLLMSGKGCGLWLWHSLDFSLTFFFYYTSHLPAFI